MAAKPIERYVKKQIAEQGGWDRILERIASGETKTAISRDFVRKDNGLPIDRSFFSRLLHDWAREAPENQARLDAADLEAADAHADLSIETIRQAPLDKDAIQRARVEGDAHLRYAGLVNRQRWGQSQPAVNVQVNVESMHLDALRHRMVAASLPLAAQLAIASSQENGDGSAGQIAASHVPHTCGTEVEDVA